MNDLLHRDHPAGERLSDYLDGDLGAPEREAVARHLEGCAGCATTLAELLAVRERARALPPLAAPDSLWASIEAKLSETPAKAKVIDLSAEREKRRWSFSTLQLVSAAAALVVVSAVAAWFVANPSGTVRVTRPPEPVAIQSHAVPDRPAEPDDDRTTPSVTDDDDDATAPPQVAAVTPGRSAVSRPTPVAASTVPATAANFGVERYDAAIADLERILAQNRSRLSPATVQVVEKNLALIDKAIEDARKALAADPASSYLNDHLAETMKRKADLLRRVTSRLQS